MSACIYTHTNTQRLTYTHTLRHIRTHTHTHTPECGNEVAQRRDAKEHPRNPEHLHETQGVAEGHLIVHLGLNGDETD